MISAKTILRRRRHRMSPGTIDVTNAANGCGESAARISESKDGLIVRAVRPGSYREVIALHGPFVVAAGGLWLATFFLPNANVPLPSCSFNVWTGLSCMFCGLTRAFSAISSGEFYFAVYSAPLAIVMYALMAAVFVWNAAALFSGMKLHSGLWIRCIKTRWIVIALGILITANWIYRIAMGL